MILIINHKLLVINFLIKFSHWIKFNQKIDVIDLKT
jgi:hypothetical protein